MAHRSPRARADPVQRLTQPIQRKRVDVIGTIDDGRCLQGVEWFAVDLTSPARPEQNVIVNLQL